jgi:hypothetical protein
MLMVYAKTLQVEWLNLCDSCRSICLLLVAIPKNIPVADVAVLSTVLEDDVYIFVICHSNKNACIYIVSIHEELQLLVWPWFLMCCLIIA